MSAPGLMPSVVTMHFADAATGLPTANRRISGNIGGMIPPGPYATVSYPPDSKKEMQLFEKIKVWLVIGDTM